MTEGQWLLVTAATAPLVVGLRVWVQVKTNEKARRLDEEKRLNESLEGEN